jgi:hypothetical protein
MTTPPQTAEPKAEPKLFVRVDEDTHRRFKGKVALEGRTIQDVLDQLVRSYLEGAA